jgi:hypothetical protein
VRELKARKLARRRFAPRSGRLCHTDNFTTVQGDVQNLADLDKLYAQVKG